MKLRTVLSIHIFIFFLRVEVVLGFCSGSYGKSRVPRPLVHAGKQSCLSVHLSACPPACLPVTLLTVLLLLWRTENTINR